MSRVVQRQGGNQVSGKALNAAWREILELGRQLQILNQSSRPYIRDLADKSFAPDLKPILDQRELIVGLLPPNYRAVKPIYGCRTGWDVKSVTSTA